MDFHQWTREVRLHVLTEEYGEDEAERLAAVGDTLVPQPPPELPPGSGTLVDSDWQAWDRPDESILLRRPSFEGAGPPVKSDEKRARDAGLTVEQWRKLSR